MKVVAAKGFTLIELMIIVTIIGILALIAAFVLLDAAEKSKMAAVRANTAAAKSTVEYKLTLDPIASDELVEEVISSLNDPDGTPDSGDENHSPFKRTIEAFTSESEAEPGQVTIIAEDDITVYIKGYGKYGSRKAAIISKVATTISNESE